MSLKEILSAVQNSFQFKKGADFRGIKYELSVLSVDQEKKVNSVVATYDNIEGLDYYNQLKKELLCEAITAINGEAIGKTVKDTDASGKEVEKDKAIFLRGLLGDIPTAGIDQLFEVYLDLKEQSEEILKKEMRYDWFKTPEQRKKEVEEKIKKDEEEKVRKAKKEEEEKNKTKTPEEPELNIRKIKEEAETEVPK
jgi:hypothetical protein